MKGLKELFQMSRQERRGTIVILALIALLLIGTLVVRSCGEDRSEDIVEPNEIEQFEAATDSVTVTVDKPLKKKNQQHAKRTKKHRSAPKKSRPEDKPRRLDPVPQF